MSERTDKLYYQRRLANLGIAIGVIGIIGAGMVLGQRWNDSQNLENCQGKYETLQCLKDREARNALNYQRAMQERK